MPVRGRESLRGHFLRCAGVSGAGSLSRPDGPDNDDRNDDAKQVQTFRGWIRVGDRGADISPEAGGVIRAHVWDRVTFSPTPPGPAARNQGGKMAGTFRGQNPHPIGPRSDPMRPARKNRDRRPETISGNRTRGRRSPAAPRRTRQEAQTRRRSQDRPRRGQRSTQDQKRHQQRPAVFRRSPKRAAHLPGRNGSPSRRHGAAERLPE